MAEERFYKIIKDIPIEDNTEDLINSEIYADALKNIIEKNENIKIGLFGDYGCGKSSIVKLLRKKLGNKKKSKRGFVHVSSWGDKPIDTMRRLFIDIDENFGCRMDLREDLYSEKNIKPKNKKIIVKFYLISLFSFISFYFLFNFCINIFNFGGVKLSAFSDLFIGLISSGVLLFLGGNAIGSLKRKMPDSLNEFENIWENLIEKSKLKSLIIVIDDLDRWESKSDVNELLDKLDFLVKSKIKINMIIPLSVTNDKFDKKTWHKSLDSFIYISPFGELEMYKLSKKS